MAAKSGNSRAAAHHDARLVHHVEHIGKAPVLLPHQVTYSAIFLAEIRATRRLARAVPVNQVAC